ncbi:carbohydrate kinase family protein [Methylobrevis pamukkalensis]|uniref:2-dehydro-3-deoxygluconokinase n=1 Tax=Methylobrevis pamukkalensis TaxID=1439726 RepID=A0A1E3H6B2_9HYPH|nr:carbohydrate kinase [Methylobrevis pamukkalensis]ODN71878.1 2-dehydro-3-deoxygluconokinase [Methylobrevis pamukkalensis]
MLLSCGDALIDFVPVKTADGRDGYVPAVGGSCLNIAVAMARLGAPTGFVAGVSNDMFGQMIADHMAASGVSFDHLRRSDDETTLAFVRIVDNEPHYAFYDETSAARNWTWRPGSIDFSTIEVVHVGSTTLINDPVSTETLKMVRDAAGRTVISLDPNCRPSLTKDRDDYRRRIEELIGYADVLRMSDVDFEFLYGEPDWDAKAAGWLAAGPKLVLLTRGGDGVVAWHASAGRIEVPAAKVTVADTIGAGDTFQAGTLVALYEGGYLSRDRLAAMTADEITACVAFGIRAAAVTVSRPGANPPWRHELA